MTWRSSVTTPHNQPDRPIPACGVDPITSASIAATLGHALHSSSHPTDIAIVPLDQESIGHGVLLFENGAHYLDNIRQILAISLDHHETPDVVVYSYREHDVLDENDIYEFDLTSAWLDSQGIQLSDWFVVTERNSRSIPTEFGRSTNWPN
jgi:hypothetical protein